MPAIAANYVWPEDESLGMLMTGPTDAPFGLVGSGEGGWLDLTQPLSLFTPPFPGEMPLQVHFFKRLTGSHGATTGWRPGDGAACVVSQRAAATPNASASTVVCCC